MASTIQIKKKRKKEKEDSLVLSILFHLFLLLLILIPLMGSVVDKKPKPPQFQGIQVMLGTPLAEVKTSAKSSSASAPAKPTPTKSEAKPKAAKKAAAPAKPKKSAPAKQEKVVSKTVTEKAPITAVKEKVVNKVDSKAKHEQQEAEAKAAKEAAQKAAEEAKRKAAEEAAKKAAAKQAAKSKFNNIMNSSEAEEGEASKGNPLGHPDASALEGLSKGKGSAGDGLGNRSLLHAPEISDNTQKQGRVIINICVSSSGKVTSAEYTQKGSTTTDSHLIDLAIKSAKKYRFSESAADEQCGEVIIDFRLR